jgi:hypothetical protein
MQNEYESDVINQIRIIQTVTCYLIVINAACKNDMSIFEVICCDIGLEILERLLIDVFKLI